MDELNRNLRIAQLKKDIYYFANQLIMAREEIDAYTKTNPEPDNEAINQHLDKALMIKNSLKKTISEIDDLEKQS
ncbi:hypothetical protein [Dyadobacter sp. 3J3]|uniref:hypothetical protein n=1 Tax=Dyadobacter sp. 3J3 TaxID=2606600 RepID=UPI00135CB271|nr:hypothetical protein [Dyadobacter sp. 3J3]